MLGETGPNRKIHMKQKNTNQPHTYYSSTHIVGLYVRAKCKSCISKVSFNCVDILKPTISAIKTAKKL